MENQEPLSPLQNAVPTKDPKNSKRQAVILMVGGLLLLAMAGGLTLYRYLTTPFINPDQESPATIQQGDTANWKTYRNEEYGFEFKYPQNLDLSEVVVGADSGSKYYYNYVSVTIDTPEDILILKNKTDDSGVSPNLFRLGAFNPINEESSPNCFITAKTITIDSISVDVCKESAESMGGPNQMYLNFTKNGLTFSAQSGSYYNENIQLVDQILSTFKFISTSTSTIDMSGWKTYKNEEYGFEFNYPSHFTINDQDKAYIRVYSDPGNIIIATKNIGRESVFDKGASPECVIKNISFSGKQARQCETGDYYQYTKLLDYPTSWSESNEIEIHTSKQSKQGYLDIISTFKFTK